MATTIARAIAPDAVVSFEINPGTLHQLLQARVDRAGPRLECVEGSVTLVSPGMSHESTGYRLKFVIAAIFLELGIKHKGLQSTTWALPTGTGDTAHEPDDAYYIQSFGRAKEGRAPDLAVEVVVSNPAFNALRAGAILGIPELWVLDVPGRLTFYHLATRGKHKGTYRPQAKSRAFPFLTAADVLERLNDPDEDDTVFQRNCHEWAGRVLAPRVRDDDGAA